MPSKNLPQIVKPGIRPLETEQMHANDKSRRSILIIDKTPLEVYKFWRNFENLPYFMKDLAEVQILSSKKSHWVVRIHSGLTAEWDAEITSEIPGSMIAWKSTPESEVQTSGAVWFNQAPKKEGTVVQLAMNYEVPGGDMAELMVMVDLEDPDSLVQLNLHRLKCYLETGEVATVDGQSSGREEIEVTELH